MACESFVEHFVGSLYFLQEKWNLTDQALILCNLNQIMFESSGFRYIRDFVNFCVTFLFEFS